MKYLWVLSLLGGDAWSCPLGRSSLGQCPEALRFSPDGRLTIYIQCSSPGEDRELNWLPAPPAPFSLILRLFGPGDAFVDGSYALPAVVRVEP